MIGIKWLFEQVVPTDMLENNTERIVLCKKSDIMISLLKSVIRSNMGNYNIVNDCVYIDEKLWLYVQIHVLTEELITYKTKEILEEKHTAGISYLNKNVNITH